MFFSSINAATALVAVTFMSQASSSVAGHARGVGHHRRSLHAAHAAHDHTNMHTKRADAGSVELPVTQLQQLQSEYAAFKSWVTNGFNNAAAVDSATYIAQFKQEFTAYDSWMTVWLESALGNGSLQAAPAPQSSSLLPLSAAHASNSVYTISVPTPSSAPASAAPAKTPTLLAAAVHNSPVSKASAGSSRANAGPSKASAGPSSVTPPSGPVQASPRASASASSAPPPASSSNTVSSGGTFNPAASNNVAVYYGQTPPTAQVKLSQVCSDPSVDIVVLAFLTTFFGPGGFPTVNFGAACQPTASTAASAKGATGLLSCPDLAQDIQTCQSAGKKVLLSLGGAEGTTAFTSDSQASTFATQLTNLFTGGTDSTFSALRPFGPHVKLDGFDVDNEDHSTAHYSAFVTALRTALDADKSKQYYISSAPQCPRPDASIPLDAMQAMDFVFVQFYNNGDCNIGASGFLDSFTAWSKDLSAKGKGPKLFIGAPACSSCAGSGYLTPQAMGGVISQAKGTNVGNFGGVMLWDGAQAVENSNFQKGVKSALG